MRILVNDYCGHPFQYDLSKELARRGYQVLHLFTSASGGPKAKFNESTDNVKVCDINIPNIKKQSFVKRWFQETNYGIQAVKVIEQFQPDIFISANTPLAAQRRLVIFCNNKKIKFIFWLQDLISIAAKSILTKKLGVIGKITGYFFKHLEQAALKKSDHIIAIADDFVDVIKKWGVSIHNTTVIPNWSPIEEIPLLSKVNEFSKKHGIEDKFVILYSGTMGMKHNPSIIVDTSEKLKNNDDIVFLVITDGIGMDYLKQEKEKRKLYNLILLPLQPFDLFPKVLASGDLLLVLLELDAGKFSVPSKVWSGYCSGRASLLIMPKENLAAKRTIDINAGIVISNDEKIDLAKKIIDLKDNKKLLETLGKNARNFAEKHFNIDKITDQFEKIIKNIT